MPITELLFLDTYAIQYSTTAKLCGPLSMSGDISIL